jgi:TolB-like protein
MGIGLLGRTRADGPVVPKDDPGLRPVSSSERFRLAILDFKNGTPDQATSYYEIALSDLLIASLSQYPGLDVPSRETLMWAHGGTKETVDASDAERLARGKGAAGVVTGKYYVRGGKIRVTLSGYRLPGREPLFAARSFEKSEEDVFTLVDEAARSIAKDLEGRLVAPPTASVDVRPCLEVARAWHSGAAAEDAAKDSRREERALAMAEKAGQTRSAAEPQAAAAARPARPVEALEQSPGGALPPAPRPGGPDRRTSPPIPALSDPELVKAWYQNRHALEECNFQKEDFEALSRSLRAQFQAGTVDGAAFRKGVENFRTGIDRLREARGRGDKGAAAGARPSIDFVCPECGRASPEFSRCETCDRFLVLRIALPGAAPEKKP